MKNSKKTDILKNQSLPLKMDLDINPQKYENSQKIENDSFSLLFLFTSIVLLFACLYLLPIQFRDLWQPDETRYAEISREMLNRGNWTVPYLLDLRYFEKPVAGYWFNNFSMWIFGENNFAVRFSSVFATFLTATLVYHFAQYNWRCRRSALLAVLIFLTMFLVLGVGTYSVLDPALMLWLTSAMFTGYIALHTDSRKIQFWCFILLGLSCSMGFLTKGFLALLLPVLVFIPYALWIKQFGKLFLNSPFILISALIVSLPWALRIAEYEPDYWHYFFWTEHVQRFIKDNAQHKAPFWYYVPVLFLAVLPWTGLFIGAVKSLFNHEEKFPSRLFLICWIFIPFVFFSFAKGKLLTYILPCMPPIALLIAGFMTRQKLKPQQSNVLDNQNVVVNASTHHALPANPCNGKDSNGNDLFFNELKKSQLSAVQWNGIINIAFGLVGIFLLIVLLLLAYISKNQSQLFALFVQYLRLDNIQSLNKIILFEYSEWHKIALGIIAFLSWAIYAVISLSKQKHNWFWVAGSPLLLCLLIGFALPNKVIHSKQPESFINAYQSQLSDSAYILTDSVGVATALAWILKRNDIYLYGAKGELEYGLSYSDSQHRYISETMLENWLQQNGSRGDIALVLHLQPNQLLPTNLPKPNKSFRWHRFALFLYKQSTNSSDLPRLDKSLQSEEITKQESIQ